MCCTRCEAAACSLSRRADPNQTPLFLQALPDHPDCCVRACAGAVQVAETLPADVLAKMHAPPKAEDVPIIDPHIINQVGAARPAAHTQQACDFPLRNNINTDKIPLLLDTGPCNTCALRAVATRRAVQLYVAALAGALSNECLMRSDTDRLCCCRCLLHPLVARRPMASSLASPPGQQRLLPAVTLMRVHVHLRMYSAALFLGRPACLSLVCMPACRANDLHLSAIEPILCGSLEQLVPACVVAAPRFNCPALQLPCTATSLPCRFGMMCAQMKAFFDATGSHWSKGALVGLLADVCSPQTDTSSTLAGP